MLQSEISKVVRSRWRSLSVEERKVWDHKADDTKAKHQADHPGGVFCPSSTRRGSVAKSAS